MKRRRQVSIATLMAVVFCTGIALALLRDPPIRWALTGLALGGVLFAVLVSVIYICRVCLLLVVRFYCWLRFRMWRPKRVSDMSDRSCPIGN
jgi:hypothetical protein